MNAHITNAIGGVKSALISNVKGFQGEIKGLSLAVFAGIFTWGFIQGLKNTILTPVIEAYIIPSNTTDALKFHMRKNQVLQLGKFLAEFIQWLIFMTVLFVIWWITTRQKANSG